MFNKEYSYLLSNISLQTALLLYLFLVLNNAFDEQNMVYIDLMLFCLSGIGTMIYLMLFCLSEIGTMIVIYDYDREHGRGRDRDRYRDRDRDRDKHRDSNTDIDIYRDHQDSSGPKPQLL